MSDTPVLLLPGLDGTGRLFAPFVKCLPEGFKPEVVNYPPDRYLDHDALVSIVEKRIELGTPHIVLAESFSGPIGVSYTLRRYEDVLALVLCASFVKNPLPFFVRWLPRLAYGVLFRMPLPTFVARMFLAGFETPKNQIHEVTAAVRKVKPAVLAARIRSLSSVDVAQEFKQIKSPVLYLQGQQDRLVGSRCAKMVMQALPSTQIKTIKAPHLVLQTQPQESVNAMVRFLGVRGSDIEKG